MFGIIKLPVSFIPYYPAFQLLLLHLGQMSGFPGLTAVLCPPQKSTGCHWGRCRKGHGPTFQECFGHARTHAHTDTDVLRASGTQGARHGVHKKRGAFREMTEAQLEVGDERIWQVISSSIRCGSSRGHPCQHPACCRDTCLLPAASLSPTCAWAQGWVSWVLMVRPYGAGALLLKVLLSLEATLLLWVWLCPTE